ncbi:hypothetical protein Hesp01_57410 [Herbidospora sp. NBRC 101105]|nr:hypothetical protein Hesp01_57410 [Herbidospora sp. NBRC 101105]
MAMASSERYPVWRRRVTASDGEANQVTWASPWVNRMMFYCSPIWWGFGVAVTYKGFKRR